MDDNHRVKISACLVVYNEATIIRRCLQSIQGIVDEIIVVHDGPCADATLTIAQEFNARVFERAHIGEAEEHRVFAMKQATGEWILQIDADEFFSSEDGVSIRSIIEQTSYGIDAYALRWEMWDGKKAIHIIGMDKPCFFRRARAHFFGVPHETIFVDGDKKNIAIVLHHRPMYNNIAWKSFWRKAHKWIPIHAEYFFDEKIKTLECFNTTADQWRQRALFVRAHGMRYILWEPLKMMLGQLKNGLWRSVVGVTISVQQYVYYLLLYRLVWKKNRQQKSRS